MKMKLLRALGMGFVCMLAWATIQAQTWTPLNNQPTKMTGGAGPGLLMHDGTVIVHDACGTDWWRLTPDNTGSYVNGTWSEVSVQMPNGYAPLYFSSAVLPDGRLIVEGGEYQNCQSAWTNMGAIYDPVKNAWTAMKPPSYKGVEWAQIGDAQSAILDNGTYMQANCCEGYPYPVAYLDAKNLTWKLVGETGKFGKLDRYDEEGWNKLDDGFIFTTSAIASPVAQQYDPTTEKWVSAGKACQLEDSSTQEIGPAVTLPSGQVWNTGAEDTQTGTGHTCTYTPSKKPGGVGTWKKGPDFPNGNDAEDAPAALEITGNAIVQVSPGVFSPPSTFYEWNGKTLTKLPAPANAPNDPSYVGTFLELPSGQLLWMDLSDTVEIFTPKGTYNKAWQPTITSVPATVTHGDSYKISGTQFNGFSQGAFYGDDNQMATNYPLVRITNTSSGHVFYCQTDNPSTMAINTGSKTVSATFIVPSGIETGASTIEVVTNGIPSAPTNITVD
jgi:hypothetical protein